VHAADAPALQLQTPADAAPASTPWRAPPALRPHATARFSPQPVQTSAATAAAAPPAAGRDERIEVSIGAIHLRIEAPVPPAAARPVSAPAAAPAPARHPANSADPARGMLARRALRRL
jgi:hypothetical protein